MQVHKHMWLPVCMQSNKSRDFSFSRKLNEHCITFFTSTYILVHTQKQKDTTDTNINSKNTIKKE